MLLTPDERKRFADYLEIEAGSSEGIVKQMEKLPGGLPDMLIEKYRTEAMACRIVAQMLRTQQDETLTS